jgi:hypothetical protein
MYTNTSVSSVNSIRVRVSETQRGGIRGHKLRGYGTQPTTALRIQIYKREVDKSCKSGGPF